MMPKFGTVHFGPQDLPCFSISGVRNAPGGAPRRLATSWRPTAWQRDQRLRVYPAYDNRRRSTFQDYPIAETAKRGDQAARAVADVLSIKWHAAKTYSTILRNRNRVNRNHLDQSLMILSKSGIEHADFERASQAGRVLLTDKSVQPTHHSIRKKGPHVGGHFFAC